MKKKKSNKRKGQEWEEKCQKTINSGALDFDKGDLKTDDYLIECKYTEKKSFSITKKILKKIWNEALESNKLPKIIVGIKDGEKDWVLDITLNRR